MTLSSVGGGVAGTCAAVSAARLGLKVALIQDRPILGGNGSSEIRVHPDGKLAGSPYPALAQLVNEIAISKMKNAAPAEDYDDQRKLDIVAAERNIALFLNMHVFKVEKAGDRITAVVAKHVLTGQELRFRGQLFADCTGDATVGFLAGADFRMGREGRDETGESLAPPKGDKMTLGTSNMWYAAWSNAPSAFPDCPWALQFTNKTCIRTLKGDWDWETGLTRDTIADAEQIRDHNFRAIYGNWSYLKNKTKDSADWRLDWVAYIGGKRESRRLLGDIILSQDDIVGARITPMAASSPAGRSTSTITATSRNAISPGRSSAPSLARPFPFSPTWSPTAVSIHEISPISSWPAETSALRMWLSVPFGSKRRPAKWA